MNTRAIKDAVKRVLPPNMLESAYNAKTALIIKQVGRMTRAAFNPDCYPYGINVFGFFRQESGLGQSCRLVANAIELAGIPHSFIDVDRTGIVGNDDAFASVLSEGYPYGINLFCVNMGDFAGFLKSAPNDLLDNRYNVAFWLWELDEFPDMWTPLINPLDEIWTPAEFVSESIRKVTEKRVVTVPYGMEVPATAGVDRAYFGLPSDKFMFLTMYDSYSIAKRKNPMGAIAAYKQAFSPSDKVGLVIKVSHGGKDEIASLKAMLSGYDAYFIEDLLPKEELNALIQAVDVYVSIHRSEGFGLVLAEAMLLGTPTIATGYSANAEFQNEDVAYLVEFELVPIGENVWPYQGTNRWAEPDVEDAAAGMRRFYEDAMYYDSIRRNAQRAIEQQLSPRCAAELVEAQTKRIYGVF